MDDVKSIEFDEESLEELSLEEDCTVSVSLSFKNGASETISFRAPTWSPIYTEPITGDSIYAIISAAYSYGEAPFLALPYGDSTYRFFDLSSTNFVDVKVLYD